MPTGFPLQTFNVGTKGERAKRKHEATKLYIRKYK
jgi:hypothetical protein